MLQLKDDATDEQKQAAVAGLRGLAGVVPGMRSLAAGLDLGLVGSHGIGMVADFDDEASFQAYLGSSEHSRVSKENLAPVMASAATVQYAID
jgi:hypothetical protein